MVVHGISWNIVGVHAPLSGTPCAYCVHLLCVVSVCVVFEYIYNVYHCILQYIMVYHSIWPVHFPCYVMWPGHFPCYVIWQCILRDFCPSSIQASISQGCLSIYLGCLGISGCQNYRHPPDMNLVQPCTIAWYKIMEYSMYMYIPVCTCTYLDVQNKNGMY